MLSDPLNTPQVILVLVHKHFLCTGLHVQSWPQPVTRKLARRRSHFAVRHILNNPNHHLRRSGQNRPKNQDKALIMEYRRWSNSIITGHA